MSKKVALDRRPGETVYMALLRWAHGVGRITDKELSDEYRAAMEAKGADRDADAELIRGEAMETAAEREFRALVSRYKDIGYGRMVQIIDGQWRKSPLPGSGVKVVCGVCDTLIDQQTGRPHGE